MNKPFARIILFAVVFALGAGSVFVIQSISAAVSAPGHIVSKPITVSVPEAGDEDLIYAALDIAYIIRERNYSALAERIHPNKGVIFTPLVTVDLNKDQRFTADQVKNFASDSAKHIWGIVGGQGTPIEMTPGEYFERYVYNYDYFIAPCIGRNMALSKGNSLNNVPETYPRAEFVELYYPSVDPAYDGLDWGSLTLVMEKLDGQYKLIAVVHGEWTT